MNLYLKCKHCGNEDQSMLEIISNKMNVIIKFLCGVCSKETVIDKSE